jgi:hypothetical protein
MAHSLFHAFCGVDRSAVAPGLLRLYDVVAGLTRPGGIVSRVGFYPTSVSYVLRALWVGSGKLLYPHEFLGHVFSNPAVPDMFQKRGCMEDPRMCFQKLVEVYLCPEPKPGVVQPWPSGVQVPGPFDVQTSCSLVCGLCKAEHGTGKPVVDHVLSLAIVSGDQTLEFLLRRHFKRERLSDPMSLWSGCANKCGGSVGTTKNLELLSYPVVFAVHLKRFVVTAGKSTYVADNIAYPAVLDLGKRLDQEVMPGGSSVYDLVAVCRHSGRGLHGGHFVTWARHQTDNKWYQFNDEVVKPLECPPTDPLECSPTRAYMIFYVRRS